MESPDFSREIEEIGRLVTGLYAGQLSRPRGGSSPSPTPSGGHLPSANSEHSLEELSGGGGGGGGVLREASLASKGSEESRSWTERPRSLNSGASGSTAVSARR